MIDAQLLLSENQTVAGETQNAIEFKVEDKDSGLTPRRLWLRSHIREVSGTGTASLTLQDSPDGVTYTNRVTSVIDIIVGTPSIGYDHTFAIPPNHDKFIRGFVSVTGTVQGAINVDIIGG